MTEGEDLLELVKFYGMHKRHDQMMASFCEELRSQAEKCGGKSCCVDRMIRDRLILADEDIVTELIEIATPTISDVLSAVDQIEKDRQMWPLIFPYLSLVEIATLFKTSRRLKKIVAGHLKGITSATLSGELIAKYPIEEHTEFYSSIGHVKDVALCDLDEKNMMKTVSLFHTIDSFSLANLWIIEKVNFMPVQMKSLTLIKVRIEEGLFEEWLPKLKELMSLHLDSVETRFMQPNRNDAPLKISCPGLRSLTVRGALQFTTIPNNLKALRLEARNLPWGYDVELYKQLETLHLTDPGCTSISLLKMNRLRSLTMNHWNGELPQSLEYLRIVTAIDPKHRQEVEGLNKLKTARVHYHPEAEAQEDLILNVLNNDCLREVIKNLNLQNLIAFANTHSRLFKLITIQFRELSIHSGNIELLKENSDFCRATAPYMRDLTIGKECEDMHWIIPLCTSLKKLLIRCVELTSDFIDAWPTNLKQFRIRMINVPKDRKAEQALGRYFGQLFGIENITLDLNISEGCMQYFCERNKHTLTSINLWCNDNIVLRGDYDWTWTSKVKLPKLDTLELHGEPPLHPFHMESLLSPLGPQLKTLNVSIGVRSLGVIINERLLPYLQELTLHIYPYRHGYSDMTLVELFSLLTLKKLTLVVTEPQKMKWDHPCVMLLIDRLSELEYLFIDAFRSTLSFQKELEICMKQKGRRLLFNSHRFG